jgi:hypothetical protein
MRDRLSTRRDRIRRLGAHLYRLGPRPIVELLLEIDAGADVVERLESYSRLDASICKYLGADRLPLVVEARP